MITTNSYILLIIITYFLFVSSKLFHRPLYSNSQCSNVAALDKIDCFASPDEHTCLSYGCCWVPDPIQNIPWCFFPKNYSSFQLTDYQYSLYGSTGKLLNKLESSPFGKNLLNLKLDMYFETPNRLRVTINDLSNRRYRVPIEFESSRISSSLTNYEVELFENPFGFKIIRKSNNSTIFDTTVAPIIYTDQYIQFSSSIPTDNIFGLGEHVLPFKLNTDWNTLTLFSSDSGTPENSQNRYGSHPFYLSKDKSNNFFGVFFLNSNAMDIRLQPKPIITYKAIGGIIDLFFFMGPTADDVISQYTELVGRPILPTYWSLGFHLCRWGYHNSSYLEKIVNKYIESDYPFDVQWTDIDIMHDNEDFTIGEDFKDLPEYIKYLNENNVHYIPMTDPGIHAIETNKAYIDGLKRGVFIMDSKGGNPIIGHVWPGDCAFPDFSNPRTYSYWYEFLMNYHELLNFDGLWIDMNEPISFYDGSTKGCENNNLNFPQYTPNVVGKTLISRTLCMDSLQFGGIHYNLHSLYGYQESVMTHSIMTKILSKRTFILSRSTFSGSGKFSAHWLGDNSATWRDLYLSIPGILNFNLFGIPMVGADICGFAGAPDEELCIRWMQLGAFYPFMRSHNEINQPDKDPISLGSKVESITKIAVKLRYSLLPYLYTLFYQANIGEIGTVVRPLFFKFFNDPTTYSIDKQFMWSDSLLVTPILEKNPSKHSGYFPSGKWFNLIDDSIIDSNGSYYNLPYAIDSINVHLYEGSIIPCQFQSKNTKLSRQNDYFLLIATKSNEIIRGKLFVDDGDTLDYSHNSFLLDFVTDGKSLKSNIKRNNFIDESFSFKLSYIKVFNQQTSPQQVKINDRMVPFLYNYSKKLLEISNFSIDLRF